MQIEMVKIIYFKRFEYVKPFVPNESSTAKKKICLEIGHNGYIFSFYLVQITNISFLSDKMHTQNKLIPKK